MRLGAGDHGDARGALEAVRLDVPPNPPQHPVPRRRQARPIRHGRPGDETDAGCGRQAKQFEQPAGGDLLDAAENGERRCRPAF